MNNDQSMLGYIYKAAFWKATKDVGVVSLLVRLQGKEKDCSYVRYKQDIERFVSCVQHGLSGCGSAGRTNTCHGITTDLKALRRYKSRSCPVDSCEHSLRSPGMASWLS